jgi:DegV family protein with EDD domain
VSLSPHEFYREVRESPIPPRTSQPPPGDFRRLFEFLLSHHDALVYVGLSRALSGTLQAAETAAARVGKPGARVVDTRHGSAAQGLLAIDAAEAAAAGWSVERIAARIEHMRGRTQLFAAVRDLSYGVRGGRAPKLALPLSRLFGFRPIIASNAKGKLAMAGVIGARSDFAERFALRIASKLDRARTYRFIIGHCDCPDDGEKLRAALRAKVPRIERDWLVEAGSAIGAHAGPGALVVGVQVATPLE